MRAMIKFYSKRFSECGYFLILLFLCGCGTIAAQNNASTELPTSAADVATTTQEASEDTTTTTQAGATMTSSGSGHSMRTTADDSVEEGTTEPPSVVEQICYNCNDCSEEQTSSDITCTVENAACWMQYNSTADQVDRFCGTQDEQCDVDHVQETEDACEVCCTSDKCNDIRITSCDDLEELINPDNGATTRTFMATLLAVVYIGVAAIRL